MKAKYKTIKSKKSNYVPTVLSQDEIKKIIEDFKIELRKGKIQKPYFYAPGNFALPPFLLVLRFFGDGKSSGT